MSPVFAVSYVSGTTLGTLLLVPDVRCQRIWQPGVNLDVIPCGRRTGRVDQEQIAPPRRRTQEQATESSNSALECSCTLKAYGT